MSGSAFVGAGHAEPGGLEAKSALTFIEGDKLSICLNMFQPFGYAESTRSNGQEVFTSDPYKNGGADVLIVPDDRLELIRAAGFDCVRMVIDVGPLLSVPEDRSLDHLIQQIVTGIDRRTSAGLKVIVDLHPLPAGTHAVSGWSDVDLIDGLEGSKFKRLVGVASRLARTISTRFDPSKVALELFNEPPPNRAFYQKSDWNAQIEQYWRQIRGELPRHTIIVAGTDFASIDGTMSGESNAGIVGLRPEHFDSNTAYAFHPYESPTFTAQGAPGFYSHVHGLTFPASRHPGGLSRAERDFVEAVNDDDSLTFSARESQIRAFIGRRDHAFSFAQYWEKFGSFAGLERRFEIVTKWADKNGVSRRQIFNTEFGVSRAQATCPNAANMESAVAFIKSVREISAALRMGLITIHEMQGDCFGISSSSPPFGFHREILSALGLR
jgi:hypothetical protein